MQAIVTKYLGPTDSRGSRVKAMADAGAVILSWDDALDPDGNHDAACAALVGKLGWGTYGRWVGGTLPVKGSTLARAYVLVSARASVKGDDRG